MDFLAKKLPLEAATQLKLCSIHSMDPYQLVLGGVYLFFKQNEKFIAIKRPLDFFSPEEIEKYKAYESVFFAPLEPDVLVAQEVARRAKMILSARSNAAQNSNQEIGTPAPYELEDATFRLLFSQKQESWNLISLAAFGNELCTPIDPQKLRQSRDENIELFERRLINAGLSVWLALQLGYCDLSFLSALRNAVFEGVVNTPTQELERLVNFALHWSGETFSLNEMEGQTSLFARKILSRWKQAKQRTQA